MSPSHAKYQRECKERLQEEDVCLHAAIGGGPGGLGIAVCTAKTDTSGLQKDEVRPVHVLRFIIGFMSGTERYGG